MKRIIGIGLAVLILGLGGLLVRQILITKPAPKPQPARPAQMAQKAQPLDPLLIEAMRQRQYQASPIIKEQDIGERGGYSTQVISFRSDGLKEYALQSVPDSPPPAGGYPVIILAHGYVNPADYRTDSGDYSSW